MNELPYNLKMGMAIQVRLAVLNELVYFRFELKLFYDKPIS